MEPFTETEKIDSRNGPLLISNSALSQDKASRPPSGVAARPKSKTPHQKQASQKIENKVFSN